MANEKNLRSFADIDKDLHKSITSKAGKKSGQVRREAKIIKDILTLILEQKGVNGDKYADIVAALVDKAISGDVRAFEVIRDTLGQKPVEEVKATIDSVNINVSVEDEC